MARRGLLTVPAAGDYDVAWEVQPIEGTLEIYVDAANGNDTNDGLTSAKAVKTLAQAMTLIRTSPYTKGQINIVGDYTTTSADVFGTTQFNKTVTLRGSGESQSTLTTSSGSLYLISDMVFDNIIIISNASGQFNIFAQHHVVDFKNTAKITYGGNAWIICGLYSPGNVAAPTAPHKLTLSASKFQSVVLANYTANASYTNNRIVPGVDFVYNSTGAAPSFIYVGGHSSASTANAIFTDDVNITVNTAMSGTFFCLDRPAAPGVATSFTNGAAVQIIYNNGTYNAGHMSHTQFKPLNEANVVAAGGSLYVLKCATGGSTLSAVDKGVYKVDKPGWIAIAKQNGVEVARSKDGVLTVPAAGDYDVTWEVQPIEGTLEIYVDAANGNDTNDGLTSAKAVKTLAQAMTLIRTSPYTKGQINIVGDYTTSSANEFGTTACAKPVTVCGSGTNTLMFANSQQLVGDTVFDNIVVATATGAGVQSTTSIFANHHTIHFTSTAKIVGTIPWLVLGSNTAAAASTAHSVTLDTGTFHSAVLGSYNATGNPAVPGVNYVQNNGSAVSGYVYVGSYGSAAAAGVTYTEDVNVIINAKTDARFVFDRNLNVKTTFQNGAALQFVFNHNSHQDRNLTNDIATMATSIDEATITAAGGSLYVLKCATGGSTLSIVDKGVYKVADAENWEAVAKQNGVEIARSKDGVLTVPAAGTYDISWEVPKFEGTMVLYVDQANGSDDNDGQSAATAFASLRKAMETISTFRASDGVINIVGAYTISSDKEMAPADTAGAVTTLYDASITIQGATGAGTDYLYFGAGLWLYGPTTFDNITLQKSANVLNGEFHIYAQHNAVNFGDSAVLNGVAVLIGGVWWANGQGASAVPHNITHDGGHIHTVYLGNFLGHVGTIDRLVPGVNYVQNGGSVYFLRLGNNAYGASENSGGNIYTDDVNITINGGTVGTSGTGFAFDGDAALAKTNFHNHALQILFNNGTTPAANVKLPTVADVQALNGKLYMFKCAADVALAVTEYAGTYTVEGGKLVVAKNASGAVVAVSKDGVLTVPAGIYTVETAAVAPYTIAQDGMSITINANTAIDFAAIPYVEKEGALFLGWYNGDAAANGEIAVGTTLTAQYYDNWNPDADRDGKGDNFFMVGASLRETKGNKSQALRFVVQLNNSVSTDLFAEVEYGTILLPNRLLGLDELVKGGVYTYGVDSYKAATVEAVNLLHQESTYVQYSAALTGIAEKQYLTAYAARGYMTYADANGVERTVYTTDVKASDMSSVAKAMLAEEPGDAFALGIVQVAETYNGNRSTDAAATAENPLSNTYKLLTTGDKKLTVGYIGGSHTLGTHAAKDGGDISLNWVNRTTNWLRTSFPDAQITSVNAGISDTATNIGLYRLEATLMNTNGHDMPDLVFVEFTKNDWTYETQGAAEMRIQIESLFRNIWQLNPNAEIVTVLTQRTENANSRLAYIEVSEHYGIPIIDVGMPLRAAMEARGHVEESEGNYYYTTDNLHPSWRGCEIYYNEIVKTFEAYLTDVVLESENLYPYGKHLPQAMSDYLITTPKLITAEQLETTGGTRIVDTGVYGVMFNTSETETQNVLLTNNHLRIEKPTTITTAFSGTSLGILINPYAVGFNIRWRVDGGEWKTFTVDSESRLSFALYDHPLVFMLEHTLGKGAHALELQFLPTADGQPVNVKLGGIAVNG